MFCCCFFTVCFEKSVQHRFGNGNHRLWHGNVRVHTHQLDIETTAFLFEIQLKIVFVLPFGCQCLLVFATPSDSDSTRLFVWAFAIDSHILLFLAHFFIYKVLKCSHWTIITIIIFCFRITFFFSIMWYPKQIYLFSARGKKWFNRLLAGFERHEEIRFNQPSHHRNYGNKTILVYVQFKNR